MHGSITTPLMFPQVQDRSEDDVDDELLSVLVVKQGRKVTEQIAVELV